jgi:hypothetical protein
VIWKYVIAWVPMVPIAIANGWIRETWYARHLGELRAHQVSTFTAVVLFGVYIWALTRIWPPKSSRQALFIGLVWLVLTLAFEFVFGHYVLGHPWSRLFHDYDLSAGRVWPAVLVWLGVAPYVFYRLHYGILPTHGQQR